MTAKHTGCFQPPRLDKMCVQWLQEKRRSDRRQAEVHRSQWVATSAVLGVPTQPLAGVKSSSKGFWGSRRDMRQRHRVLRSLRLFRCLFAPRPPPSARLSMVGLPFNFELCNVSAVPRVLPAISRNFKCRLRCAWIAHDGTSTSE
jgi:hypothetical protein